MSCFDRLYEYFFPVPKTTVFSANDDVLQAVFSKLPPTKLAKICVVSKQWNRVVGREILWNQYELEDYFPSVFLEKSWRNLGENVESIKMDKRAIFKILYSRCPFSNKRVYETHSLVLIPEGMSFNKLLFLPEVRKFPRIHTGSMGKILDRFGDIKVEKHRVILITKTIVEETRGKLDKNGFDFLRYGYQTPDLITVIVSNIMRGLSPHPKNNRKYKLDLVELEEGKGSFFTKLHNFLLNLVSDDFHGTTIDHDIATLYSIFTICQEGYLIGGTRPKKFSTMRFEKYETHDQGYGIAPMRHIDFNQKIEIKIL